VRLHYHEEGGVTEFYHTFTPKKLRGQNLAAMVSQAAFEYALSQGLKIRPTCSYLIDTFLPRHKEFQSSNLLMPETKEITNTLPVNT